MHQHFTHAVVLDFEATCDDVNPPQPQEIIEFPSVLISLEDMRVVDEFESFVRPIHHPHLSEFCTRLTSITSQDVAGADPFPVVLASHQAWLASHGLDSTSAILVTCGDWDLATMLPSQCMAADPAITSLPQLYARWQNVKEAFKSVTGRSKAPGMPGMMDAIGLRLIGRHHRGIDDCRNIAELYLMLLRQGAAAQVTSELRAHRFPDLQIER